MKKQVVIKYIRMLMFAGGILSAGWWLGTQHGAAPGMVMTYTTAAVQQGDIMQQVTSNGELQPVNLIVVGTQASGEVSKLYADYNDKVKKGQILAEIDTSLLEAQIKQSEAQFANTVSATKLAELNAERNKRLFDAGYIPRNQWEASDQDARTARTNMDVAQSQLERDRVNLSYAVIRSPVDGIVISREVSQGQTVQASFQTPELFHIATDLTNMQINLSLGEADIGQVKEGQEAQFTVDAYKDDLFNGEVSKVRISPTNTQGVVTYSVLLHVSNPELKLLPGMTAYVNVITAKKENVLRVPTAALRYVPSGEALAPGKRRVYRLKAGKPDPVEVETGLTDGQYTEITSGNVKEGDALITQEVPHLNQ